MDTQVKKVFWDGSWRYLTEKNLVGSPCAAPLPGEAVYEAVEGGWRLKGGDEAERVPCPDCAKPASKTSTPGVWSCGTHTFRIAETPPEPKPRVPGTMEYKILTQRDSWFKNRFTPEMLEQRLNDLGSEGWRVVGVVMSSVGKGGLAVAAALGGITGPDAARQEVIIFLERVVK